jgi:lysozyme
MSKARVIVGLGLLAAAAFAGTRAIAAVREGNGAGGLLGPADISGAWSEISAGGGLAWPSIDIDPLSFWTGQTYYETQGNTMPSDTAQRNIAALLETIKRCEGTAGQPDPYRVCYAYRHTIRDLRDHPAITGEWRGETLPDDMCRAAGFGAGCVSTAAGAYQIIKPTWTRLKGRLGLPDFGPASQDAAAIQLLRERGALAKIERGDLAGAIAAARKEWASLPGAGYGQGERTMAWVQARYLEAGGTLA